MVTHSSILAWETPWTEEPGGHSPWHPELNMTAHTCTQGKQEKSWREWLSERRQKEESSLQWIKTYKVS